MLTAINLDSSVIYELCNSSFGGVTQSQFREAECQGNELAVSNIHGRNRAPWTLHNRRGAESAASGVQRNVTLALRTFLFVGKGLLLVTLHQRIHRQHHEIVHGRSDEQERDDRVDEITIKKLRPVYLEIEAGEVRLAGDGRDNRGEQVFHEGGDYGAKRGTDNDAHRKIDNIAAQNKLAKSFEHEGLRKKL